jgi:hypothetical protein
MPIMATVRYTSTALARLTNDAKEIKVYTLTKVPTSTAKRIKAIWDSKDQPWLQFILSTFICASLRTSSSNWTAEMQREFDEEFPLA